LGILDGGIFRQQTLAQHHRHLRQSDPHDVRLIFAGPLLRQQAVDHDIRANARRDKFSNCIRVDLFEQLDAQLREILTIRSVPYQRTLSARSLDELFDALARRQFRELAEDFFAL
jgi:hypothetical protein